MIFLSKLQKTIFITAVFLTPIAHAANQKPIANAGEDQNVNFSSNVTLSGSKSVDTDGEIKTYQWTQTKGSRVVLKNSKTVSATFTSPKKNESLIFKLTIKDNKNASAIDMVTVNVNAQIVQATATSPLNDTGITFCSDGAFNVNSCGISQYPRQDAEFGRDFFDNDDKDGHAGFSFTKISSKGEKLPFDAPVWACVKDNVTGLLWEVKTPKNAIENYAVADTDKFVKTINSQKLCGETNWRLPQIQELQSIVDYSVPLPNPNIDLNFFPNSTSKIYWSATDYAKTKNDVWGIYFEDGRIFEQDKKTSAAIRLVSSAQKPTAKNYVISKDGNEVFDSQTGLTWRRCVEGMKWNGKTCVGYPFGGMLVESLQRAASEARLTGKNWRLPNIKELSSLIDTSQPDLAIDSTVFPETPNDQMWSSSPYALDAFFGWAVHFYYGSSYYTYLEDIAMMRLVRE
jgi:hypothetical protein